MVQEIIALVIVLISVSYTLYKAYQFIKPSSSNKASCSGCSNCEAKSKIDYKKLKLYY